MEFISELFNNWFSVIRTFQFKDAIDIIAITLIIYGIFKLVRETRAEQLLKGILILLVIYIASLVFNLTMLTSLIRLIIEFGVIIVVIVFQPEIRSALEQLGRSKLSGKPFGFFQSSATQKSNDLKSRNKKAINDVVIAVEEFSKNRTGALIVFERQTKLSDIASTGTVLNSETSPALIGNIFYNKAPLHDGACIIREGMVYAAGCILPLTVNKNVNINLGTRHRAALGMSENSDAVVLVVSEESGTVSLAVKGTLLSGLEEDELKSRLIELLVSYKEEKPDFLSSIFSKRKGDKDDEKI